MAHLEQLNFVSAITNKLDLNSNKLKILEIGSYDVNGNIRSFFPKVHYIGIDLISGPGVDIVCSGDKLKHKSNTYDLVISCECFEHNPKWKETFINMFRMLKEGGVFIFTCASDGRPEHGTSKTNPKESPGTSALGSDYYRNLSKNDFIDNFDFPSNFLNYFFYTNKQSFDLYFFGIKKSKSKSKSTLQLAKKINGIKDLENLINKSQNKVESYKRNKKFIPKFMRRFLAKYLFKVTLKK